MSNVIDYIDPHLCAVLCNTVFQLTRADLLAHVIQFV